MKKIFTCILLALSPAASAQTDSTAFEEVLARFLVHQDNFELARSYADSLVMLATEQNDPLLLVRATYVKGFMYRSHDQFRDALVNYQLALKTARDHGFSDREAMILNGLGMTYNMLGRYPEALRHLFRSLEIRKEIQQDEASMAIVLNNIGVVYFNLEDYSKAADYFGKSYAADSTQQLKLVNLGLVEMENNNGQQAFNYFEKFRRQNPDTLTALFMEYLIGRGLYHKKRENYDSALMYFERSAAIGRSRNLDYQLAATYYNMAASFYDRRSFSKAVEYAVKSDSLAALTEAKKLILQNAHLLAKANNRLGNYTEASAYFVLHDSLNARFNDATMYGEVYDLEIDEVESMYAELLKQKEDLLVSQRRTKYLFLGLAIILGIAGLLVYRTKRIKESMLRQLSFAQGKIIEKEKMAALGRLMAGIGHELNTPLGGLRGLLKQLGDRLERLIGFYDEVPENVQWMKGSAASGESSELSSRTRRQLRKELQAAMPDISPETVDMLCDLGITEVTPEQQVVLGGKDGMKQLGFFHEVCMVHRNMSHMNHAVSRMTTVVGAMHTYTRAGGGVRKTEIVDLRENMEMVLILLQNSLKRGVTLDIDLPDTPVLVSGDKDRLAQIWTNLIMNSLQAMEYNGMLRINMSAEEDVRVIIEDDGPGIPEHARERVFEAFFTTRVGTDGTGLGLSIVKSIVQDHSGQVSFVSQSGMTRFTVVFPKANDVP